MKLQEFINISCRKKLDFVLVHGLDGYDEISLTHDSKIITKQGEEIYSAEDLGFNPVTLEDIKAGETIQETAKIFMNILEGNGTEQQNSVILANHQSHYITRINSELITIVFF